MASVGTRAANLLPHPLRCQTSQRRATAHAAFHGPSATPHLARTHPHLARTHTQVAKDLAELQAAVGQQLHPLEQLGQPYRAVKAFRALLFTPASGIAANPLLGELPPAVTLHHLFSRCETCGLARRLWVASAQRNGRCRTGQCTAGFDGHLVLGCPSSPRLALLSPYARP